MPVRRRSWRTARATRRPRYDVNPLVPCHNTNAAAAVIQRKKGSALNRAQWPQRGAVKPTLARTPAAVARTHRRTGSRHAPCPVTTPPTTLPVTPQPPTPFAPKSGVSLTVAARIVAPVPNSLLLRGERDQEPGRHETDDDERDDDQDVVEGVTVHC